jgi:hypothetical protein
VIGVVSFPPTPTAVRYHQANIFFSHEERVFDGNLCASVKNLPLDIKLGSVPMNLEEGEVEYIQLYFVFVNILSSTNAGCQLTFFKLLLNLASNIFLESV